MVFFMRKRVTFKFAGWIISNSIFLYFFAVRRWKHEGRRHQQANAYLMFARSGSTGTAYILFLLIFVFLVRVHSPSRFYTLAGPVSIIRCCAPSPHRFPCSSFNVFTNGLPRSVYVFTLLLLFAWPVCVCAYVHPVFIVHVFYLVRCLRVRFILYYRVML